VWRKQRFNRSQEFVVGGYVPSPLGLDSLVIGVDRGKELHYVARVRAEFIPGTRRQVFDSIKQSSNCQMSVCQFAGKEPGRWGQGLTAEKMRECVWLLCRIRHSSHNVECRTMPHAFAVHDFDGDFRRITPIPCGIIRSFKGLVEKTAADRPA